eukprot:7743388-Pyramimonas_sp.AAC.1
MGSELHRLIGSPSALLHCLRSAACGVICPRAEFVHVHLPVDPTSLDLGRRWAVSIGAFALFPAAQIYSHPSPP